MKIKIVKDFRPDHNGGIWFRAGEVFQARRITLRPFDLETPYQIIDGCRSGTDVPFECCVALPKELVYTQAEFTAVHQELLQRREEVNELMRRVAVAAADEKQAVAAADRLQDNVAQLQRVLSEARQSKKVPLPRKVLEAINSAWAKVLNGQPRSVKHLAMTNWDLLQRRAEAEVGILHDYAYRNPVEYMAALVYGHTNEKTPEERLRDGIKDVIARWDMETAYGAFPCAPFLPERIAAFVQSSHVESSAANG